LIELENPPNSKSLAPTATSFRNSHLASRVLWIEPQDLCQVTAGDDVVPQICERRGRNSDRIVFHFAVRAKRSDKRFPHNSMFLEREVAAPLFDKLEAAAAPQRSIWIILN